MSNGWTFDADDLGKRARAMLEHVEALKTEHSQKAVLAGVYLRQVKAVLPHGEFESWKKKYFPKSRSMIAYLMSLAEKFSRSAKVMMPELVAAQQLSLDLQAPKGAGQAFKQKLVKFVGSLGLTDLLRRHGILKKGGKKTKQGTGDGGQAKGETPAASLSPEALAYGQMVEAVEAAQATLLDETRWSLLTPAAAAKVDPLLKKLASDFHNRLLQSRHETAAAAR